MMKQCKFLAIFLLAAIFLAGCQKDETPLVSDTESIENEVSNNTQRSQEVVDITHTYLYRGETFSITYTLDEAQGEVLIATGDENMASQVFGSENGPEAMFFEDPSEQKTTILVRVFDTNAEMEHFLQKERNIPEEFLTIPEEGVQTSRTCYSWNYSGFGNFYFYRHKKYTNEMTGLRRTNTSYSGNHWVGPSYNDQLSSLIVNKPSTRWAYVSLHEHSCYDGRKLIFWFSPGNTTLGIHNLKWYTLSGWWFWGPSWNDRMSSYIVVHG